MSERGVLYHQGELHLSLEVVAEVYRIRTVWLRQVYDRGLLGPGLASDGAVYLVASRLDHVATLVRLQHLIGPDLDELCFELD